MIGIAEPVAHDWEIESSQVEQFGVNPAAVIERAQQRPGHARTPAAHAARAEEHGYTEPRLLKHGSRPAASRS